MLPWKNSWFQIAFFTWLVSGALLVMDYTPKVPVIGDWSKVFQHAPSRPSQAPAQPVPSKKQSPAKAPTPAQPAPRPSAKTQTPPIDHTAAKEPITPPPAPTGEAPPKPPGPSGTTAAQGPVWTDPSTGLMWARYDNGAAILTWQQAQDYCRQFSLEGYSGWRLPTIDELEGIFDPAVDSPLRENPDVDTHLKGGINLSGEGGTAFEWSSTLQNSTVSVLDFVSYDGHGHYNLFTPNNGFHALCVRRATN